MKKQQKNSLPRSQEVDLHAERFNEGKEKLANFMRESFDRGRSPVRIIHGKGGGVMRDLAHLWIAENAHKVGREVDEGGGSLLVYFRFS